MKKFPLLLAAVAVIAVGSAFAAPRDLDPNDIYVQTSPGTFQLKSQASGYCTDLESNHCEYTRNAQGQYIPADEDQVWVNL